MLTTNNTEINLSAAINSIVRCRALDGSRKDVRIVQHEGNVAIFIDEKGNKYSLPEEIKFKVFSAGLGTISLKEIWEEFGAEWVSVEDYLGEKTTILISGISHEKYGFPTPFDFSYQEGNFVISPNDKESEPIENVAIVQVPLDVQPQVQANPIDNDENWLQSDGGGEHFMGNHTQVDG